MSATEVHSQTSNALLPTPASPRSTSARLEPARTLAAS